MNRSACHSFRPALGRAPLALAAVVLLCPPLPTSSAQEVKLRSGELEKRLQAVRKLACGRGPVPLPKPPWTRERLLGYHEPIKKATLKAYLQPIDRNSIGSFQSVLHHNALLAARARLALTTEKPGRPHREQLLAWHDTWVVRCRAFLQDLSIGLDTLGRYVAYTRSHGVGFDRQSERELASLLRDLESHLRSRLIVSRVLYLTNLLTQPPAGVSPDLVRTRLAEARKMLTPARRDADTASLSAYLAELEKRIHGNKLANTSARTYTAFLLEQYKDLLERERKLKDVGRGNLEREELRRRRTQTRVEIWDYVYYTDRIHLRSLRFSVLRGHLGLDYGGTAGARLPAMKLSANHDFLAKYFDRRALEELRAVRALLDSFEKNCLKEGFRVWLEDWWVKRGRDLPSKVLDAVLDDMTRWMAKLPATRQAIKRELLEIAGFPRDKDRMDKLTPEERRKVERLMKRSVKDICRDFDRNTLYVLRQDLDLLEQLRKAYPTHTLVLAGKPVWPGEPKGRLRLTHCRDLGPPAAARAYLHLFEQLSNDWGAYASERNRFLVAIDLNINMHLQAAAGK